MINNYQNLGSSRYSKASLSPDLLARLRTIREHKRRLARQVNTFSTPYPHPGFLSRRWYNPTSAIKYPHLAVTKDHGSKVNLYILQSKYGRVIHLKKQNGVWWEDDVFAESEIGAMLPASSSYSGARLIFPASIDQMQALARRLMLPVGQLPNLTAYNACLLIQETIMHEYIDDIQSLIANCGSPSVKAGKSQLNCEISNSG